MYFLIISSIIFFASTGSTNGVDETLHSDTDLSSQSNTFCEAGIGRDYFKCNPTQVEYFASSNSNDEGEKIVQVTFDEEHRKLALCAEPAGDATHVNLMLHVFCRQMGYTTYVTRRTTNIMEDSDRAIVASALCNGTEQRLQDCYWPHVTLTRCKQVIEVTCGSCSKYFSHDDGIIMTPGFPNSFPFTVQCDWIIHTHLGSEIELRFLAFNIPQSLLPTTHIGTSTCEASYPFIEIRPHPYSDNLPEENKTLANAARYCVTNNPPKRLVIKSKAVWLHFSSGIHSSYMSSYRSRSSPKRAIGLKIHYKALPGSLSGNNSQYYYMYAGACALFALLIFTTVACFIYFNKKRSAWNEEPELSYSNKWPRSICSSGISRNTSKSCRKTLESRREHMLSHNYEEIAPPPQVPPRPFRPVSNLTWSSDDARRIAPARRPALSYRSPPTYQSRHNLLPMHYMQLVCDSEGNCQYIPKEEIEAAALTHRIIPRVYGSNVFSSSDVPPYPDEALESSKSPPSSSARSTTKATIATVSPVPSHLQYQPRQADVVVEKNDSLDEQNTKEQLHESNVTHASNESLSPPSSLEKSNNL